jgi:hypothetical protein
VALSHPLLHPEASPKAIRRYSQQYVDLIDLEDNQFKTLPISEVLEAHYPALRYLAQLDEGGYLTPLRSMLVEGDPGQLVLTFDGLLRRTPLASRLNRMLQILEKNYHSPVDTEFTVEIEDHSKIHPDVKISLLQCRPQSQIERGKASLPQNLDSKEILFSTRRMAPEGRVNDIRWVVFVSPECYYSLPTPQARATLGRAIGALNAALKNERFICIGPGRWGTSNPDLGLQISYGDIYNTSALVELTGLGFGPAPEASFGTHFFQDLLEEAIIPLAIYLDDPDVVFNRKFFYQAPNRLASILPNETGWGDCLRLIEVGLFQPGHHLELVMDDQQGQAVAYLEPD